MFQAHTEDTHYLHAAPQSVPIAAGRRRTVPPRRGRPPKASKSAFTPPVGQRIRGQRREKRKFRSPAQPPSSFFCRSGYRRRPPAHQDAPSARRRGRHATQVKQDANLSNVGMEMTM
jgi:hypothetical protein